MVRVERVRVGLLCIAALIPGLLCGAVIAGQLLPRGRSFDATVLAPTAFLGFAVLSLVAPLAAGGGNELFPPEQLVAFPIRPGTSFFESLLVAPLNLAWMSQFVLLFGITSFVTGARPGLGLALVTALVYVAMVTTAGQLVAWLLIGVRQSVSGRRAVWIAIGALALITVGRRAGAPRLRGARPCTDATGGRHGYGRGRPAVRGLGIGHRWHWVRSCSAGCGAGNGPAPGPCGARAAGARSAKLARERRRPVARTALLALIRLDRTSVWRAAPLRRGLVVLTLVPGLVAAGAALHWDSVVLIPALVAAGAGLLYGVNMFCLDASGALWLASLPHSPRLAITAKTIVLAETIGGSCLVAAFAGSLRASGSPRLADLAAMAGCLVSCTALVLATCLRLSLRRPNRADLRGHRDTPAPPATMAVYSVRLATITTLVGLLFSLAAHENATGASLVLAGALATLGGLSIARSLRRWDDPAVRSRVVAAVSNG